MDHLRHTCRVRAAAGPGRRSFHKGTGPSPPAPGRRPRRIAWTLGTACTCVAVLFGPAAAAAQGLPLKRTLPEPTRPGCPADPPTVGEETPEDLRAARQLRSMATQAAILGDQSGARDMLQRAAELNPSDAALAYDLARAHEVLGDRTAAFLEYCRTLVLAPEGPDAPDARASVELLEPPPRSPVPPDAVDVFTRGLEYYDRGRLNPAMLAFQEAVRVAPDWADARYNLGAVKQRLGMGDQAASDLTAYVRMNPDAEDVALVQQQIDVLVAPPVTVDARGTLVRGLVVPGLGHFHTGRPLTGVAVAALAAGSLATGYFIESVEVLCLGVPVDGRCPPGQERARTSDRPFLLAGIGGAVVVTVLGAIHAYRGVTSSGQSQTVDSPVVGVSLAPPSVEPAADGVRLNLVQLRF